MPSDRSGAPGAGSEPTNGNPDSRDRLAERRGLAEPVYAPAEDSGLLAAGASEHARGTVLEVGTGSGWVAERVTDLEGVDRVVGSDVNPHACRRAREREVEAVRADLLGPFREGAFDTILFNPPYLPTDPESEWDDWQEAALSGGESGRQLVEPFLDDLKRVLEPTGVALLLVSSLAGFGEVVEYAVDRGFRAETVREESFPYETLSVLALTGDN